MAEVAKAQHPRQPSQTRPLSPCNLAWDVQKTQTIAPCRPLRRYGEEFPLLHEGVEVKTKSVVPTTTALSVADSAGAKRRCCFLPAQLQH